MSAIVPEARQADVIVAIRYRAGAIVARIVAFQLLPIIVATKVAFGRVEKPLLLDVALAGGAILYVTMMIILIRALRRPVVLSVSRDGGLRWRPMFTDRDYRLPTGSVVSVTDRQMTVAPAIAGVSGTMSRDGHTIFQLPGGIHPPATGVWQI
jgi:hypothetical protein